MCTNAAVTVLQKDLSTFGMIKIKKKQTYKQTNRLTCEPLWDCEGLSQGIFQLNGEVLAAVWLVSFQTQTGYSIATTSSLFSIPYFNYQTICSRPPWLRLDHCSTPKARVLSGCCPRCWTTQVGSPQTWDEWVNLWSTEAVFYKRPGQFVFGYWKSVILLPICWLKAEGSGLIKSHLLLWTKTF